MNSMETFIYWILTIGYLFLGILVGLILTSLLYPVVRTFPKTLLLVIGGQLRMSALVHIGIAFSFPIVLVGGGYFLLNLLTPAWDIATSRSFLTGLIFSFLSLFFSGGTSKYALQADYADFIRKHLRIPEGATFEELQFARAVTDWWLTSGPKELSEMKSQYMYHLAASFDFDVDHEPGLRKSFEFLKVDSENHSVGLDIYQSRKEYAMSMRELEADRLAQEEEDREDAKRHEEWLKELEQYDDDES